MNVFRQLAAVEEADGYQLICDTVDLLRAKGIKLWEKPLPREVYASRQARGENFGLFVNGELAVIVSLRNDVAEHWREEIKAPAPIWLSTLATATKFRGRNLGRQAVAQALRHCAGRQVYLDCSPGWLVAFYESLGFVALGQKSIALAHGVDGHRDVILMKWLDCPESARLRFRPITARDVDNLLAIFGDPVAMEFWPATKTRDEIANSIEWIQQCYKEHGYGLWAVELKETGEFVGRVGLLRQEQGIEVAYALVPRHWHRGYATEAARACRDWAFAHLDCDRVISLVHTHNQRSCRVAERNGMHVVAEITRAGLAHHVYAITRTEWKKCPIAGNYFAHQSAAERYARYRLYFHPLVIGRIRQKLGLTSNVPRALDVACGTGLSTVALAEIAEAVVGVDCSAAMLAQARQHPRVSYRQGQAESLPVGDAEYDLVTVALGFHWFQQERFLTEARRVLRPGGWLVIYNQGFGGQMRDSAVFMDWYRNIYLHRFPSPPRRSPDLTQELAAAHGFGWQGSETFGHEETLTVEEFVGGLLTQSNVIAAVEQGGQSLAGVADWLMTEVGRNVPNGTGQFVFGGRIWYAQRAP